MTTYDDDEIGEVVISNKMPLLVRPELLFDPAMSSDVVRLAAWCDLRPIDPARIERMRVALGWSKQRLNKVAREYREWADANPPVWETAKQQQEQP